MLALKGATTEVRDQAAAEGLRDDLESRGPVRLSEVEAQQKEILEGGGADFFDQGSIVIGGGGDDSFV